MLVYGIYVFGMYKQALPDSALPAMAMSLSNIVFDNLPKACMDLMSLYLGSNYDHKHHNKPISSYTSVDQCEATMLYLESSVEAAPKGSVERKQAQQNLDDEISHRSHTECAIKEIGKALFGEENYYEMIMTIRSPVVDDWNCYKTMPIAYMKHCGKFYTYGLKFMSAFASMCNAGFQPHQVAEVASQVCNNKCTLGLFDQAFKKKLGQMKRI